MPPPCDQVALYMNNLRAMKKKDVQLLAEIKLFIDLNLSKDISVKELCLKFAINRNKLQAGFKFLYTQTIHAYILQQKMEMAAEKLATSGFPVKAIALELGYTASNFHSKFKRKFGYTPEQFRERNRGAITAKGI